MSTLQKASTDGSDNTSSTTTTTTSTTNNVNVNPEGTKFYIKNLTNPKPHTHGYPPHLTHISFYLKLGTEDLTVFVQSLLEQMSGRFEQMSDAIVGRLNDMGNRIDELETSIGALMTQAGLEEESQQTTQQKSSGDTTPTTTTSTDDKIAEKQ